MIVNFPPLTGRGWCTAEQENLLKYASRDLYSTNQRLRQPQELSAWGRDGRKNLSAALHLSAALQTLQYLYKKSVEEKNIEKAYLFKQPPRLNFNFFVPAVRMTNERVSNRVQTKPQTLNFKHQTRNPERVSNRIQRVGAATCREDSLRVSDCV